MWQTCNPSCWQQVYLSVGIDLLCWPRTRRWATRRKHTKWFYGGRNRSKWLAVESGFCQNYQDNDRHEVRVQMLICWRETPTEQLTYNGKEEPKFNPAAYSSLLLTGGQKIHISPNFLFSQTNSKSQNTNNTSHAGNNCTSRCRSTTSRG
jgi:hypothetical protein